MENKTKDYEGRNCEPGMFRCENGPCIQESLRCNGRVECPFDQSDELDCVTTTPRPTYRKSRVLELKLEQILII